MLVNIELVVLRVGCLSLFCLLSQAASFSDSLVECDTINRIVAINNGPNAIDSYFYDFSGNRTNRSTILKFAVAGLSNHQIAADFELSLPLATIGSLPVAAAMWTIRSSNHQLVPKSNVRVIGAGTASPIMQIVPAAGAVGTTTITIIANDGQVAAATSFILNVGANHPPRAINDSAQHPPGEGTKIEKKKFLSNDSDPDGDTLTMTGLSATSAHGGAVRFFGPFIEYTPPLGYDGPDFFNYTVTDSHGASAVATVSLKSQPSGQAIPITVISAQVLPNGNRLVTFIGVPSTTYEIQASVDLSSWVTVGNSVANTRGLYLFEDREANSFPIRFYRSVFR